VQPLDLHILEVGPAWLTQAPRMAKIVKLQTHVILKIALRENGETFIAPVAFFPSGHFKLL
jgi:hypothetical protein